MTEMIFLFGNPPSIDFPHGFTGWIGWFFFLGLAGLFVYRGWHYQRPWNRQSVLIITILTFLVPVTCLVLPGIRLASNEVSRSIVGGTPNQVLLLPFAGVPWFFAAGLIGVGPAAVLAAASGLLIASWATHNPFLSVELAACGAALGLALRQPYRTTPFRLLRRPAFAGLLLAGAYPVIYMLESIFLAQGLLIGWMENPLNSLLPAWTAVGGSLVLAGLTSELFRMFFPKIWIDVNPLSPSPPERKLRSRFLYGLVPLVGILVLLLVLVAWTVASRASQQMLRGQMFSAAEISAKSMPYYIETGQTLVTQLANDRRLVETKSPGDVQEVLDLQMRGLPFFDQIVYFDENGQPYAGSPASSSDDMDLSPEELASLEYAEKIPIQIHSVQPEMGSQSALISFISAVKDDSGGYHGALIARSDLARNPLTKPLRASLDSLIPVGGEGMLLDESGRVLYHPDKSRIMSVFQAERGNESRFYTENTMDGSRWLVHYQPVQGRSWSVVIRVPMQYAQEQAIAIITPLLGVFFLFSLLAIGFILVGLRAVTGSIQKLAVQADRMASGQLDEPLEVQGVDEIGQLGQAFEQMRASLKTRMDELNRLLLVSQKASASLDIEDSLRPALESALVTGAAAARICLVTDLFLDHQGESPGVLSFGAGPASEAYRYLDDQILPLSRQQDRVQIPNLTRPRLLAFSPEAPHPQSLLAFALRNENMFFGTLWLGFTHPQAFQEDEVRYLATLAGQAALTAANIQLFRSAELGRQRLEVILTSTPDPVLVTDHQGKIILANPVATQVLNLGDKGGIGKSISSIQVDGLADLLRTLNLEKQSAELTLPDGRVYLATSSAIVTENQRMGRVCVMRDITHLKEIDTLKSEFVSAVSHDLRQPLTLIQGYASILQMVGDLNDQQGNYVGKIINSVEGMTRLVSNLLDLGRIEAGIALRLEHQPAQSIVEDVVDSLQVRAIQKRVLLSSDLPKEELPLVEADHALIRQALNNLVENAITFTDVSGKVSVGLFVDSARVVYFVQDNGIGIAPADQQRLFEKISHSRAGGKKGTRSTGLGLAIVRSIAERHAGQVWVDSQLGKGSTFYISIPLQQTDKKT